MTAHEAAKREQARRLQASAGLGDTIEKAIKFTGLDKLAPSDCNGCEERKEKLNKTFPYKK